MDVMHYIKQGINNKETDLQEVAQYNRSHKLRKIMANLQVKIKRYKLHITCDISREFLKSTLLGFSLEHQFGLKLLQKLRENIAWSITKKVETESIPNNLRVEATILMYIMSQEQ